MAALPAEFYDRPVLEVARELIGCVVSCGETGGVIVETEAYHESEPACHAFVGLTPRTQTLFGPPGRAYVYRSYGIHALLNAVCEPAGVGAAVLIRALAPVRGLGRMRERRGLDRLRARASASAGTHDVLLCSGPGKLTQALGVDLAHNASSLSSGPVRIHGPAGAAAPLEREIVQGRRIGITKAPELPWRFSLAGDENVSRPRPPGWALRARRVERMGGAEPAGRSA